jgi:response regulator RpfG family c-di-GMP phosphodiesterase
LVRQLCDAMSVPNAWEVEIAAMVSQIGCVTIPEATLAKYYSGAPLALDEQQMLAAHPRTGRDLVAKIPRLQNVAEYVAFQNRRFDGSGDGGGGSRGKQIPLGGRLLKTALDFDMLVANGATHEEAVGALRERHGWYDPDVLDALAVAIDAKSVIRMVRIADLNDNMVLDEHVVTNMGEVLIARGQEVSASLRERLENYARTIRGVREPIRVRCAIGAARTADAAVASRSPTIRGT